MPKSPEEFNPSDEQYKKVEDLPEEVQDRFSDVPEEHGGGFVRKEAAKLYERSESETEESLPMWKRGVIKLEELLKGESPMREKLIIKNILESQIRFQEVEDSTLRKEIEYKEKLDRVLSLFDNYVSELKDEMNIELNSPMIEGLKNAGHEGRLFIKDCGHGGERCRCLYGNIDGEGISIHSLDGGSMMEVFNAYKDIAVDKGDYEKNLRTLEDLRNELGKFILSDETPRDLYFKRSLTREEFLKMLLKEDNSTVRSTIKRIWEIAAETREEISREELAKKEKKTKIELGREEEYRRDVITPLLPKNKEDYEE